MKLKIKRHIIALVSVCTIMAMASCGGSNASQQSTTPTDSASADTDTTATATTAVGDSVAVNADNQATQADNAAADNLGDPNRLAPIDYNFRPGRSVGGKLVALTFDDGPSQATPKVLAALRKHNAVATFFVCGVAINPTTAQYMRQAVNMGCEICSHTWDHPWMSTLNYDQTRQTIERTNQAIKDAVGYTPNFFRPPYIDVDQRVLNYAGLPGISGISSDDYITTNSPEKIAQNVLNRVSPGSIIVMHDLGANMRTPVALDTIIPALKARGYTLVTVSDLFTSAGVTPKPYHLYQSAHTSVCPPSSFTYRERKMKKAAPAAPAN